MNDNNPTGTDRRNFWSYFDIADQLYGIDDDGYQWTVKDFTKSFVKEAKKASERLGLSWPPYRPEAEEFANAHKWVYKDVIQGL
jgi:hypothetical protein